MLPMRTSSAALLFCFAFAADIGSAGELTLADIFPTDRVLDIQITVAEEDWDTIRNQTRNLFAALAESRKQEPIAGPYTYVEASVTIDGVEFPRVGLRKKGFIGSLSTSRPSLKIKLNHIDPQSKIEGLNSLTLNNNKQDVAQVSQFMGYALFNAAGSPAPRCAFANVTVNGKNLGIYSHVESLRKPLVRRAFNNDSGTLYEGTVVDFYPGWEGSFEHKFGCDDAREKIKQLIDALSGSGGPVLLGPEPEGRLKVPTSGEHDKAWTAVDFDDSGWVQGRGGAGYEANSGYESFFSAEFDVREAMYRKGESVYLRYPFQVDDPERLAELTLRMKFDDGFIAYLNGHRVASANAPEEAAWDSRATGQHDDRVAVSFQSLYISEHLDKLRKGRNVLAIHGLNAQPESSDLLIVAEVHSSETPALPAIAGLVDLDAFYKFWAVESLLGFWDGYSGNRNNFFAYLNPENDKFHFIPWGADSLFVKYSMINRDRSMPLSVKTEGLIAHRLYQTPSGRERYRRTIRELMDKHWDEEKLLAETDRIETLLSPYAKESHWQARFPREIEKVREFIRSRRGEIEEEIADGMPIWTKPPAAPPLFPEGAEGFARRQQEDRRPPGGGDDLWSAARTGDVEAIGKHLGAVDINAKDLMGSTALSWAAGLGRLDAVQFLIEKGADVNLKNRDGTTPLDGTERELDDNGAVFLERFFRVKVDPEEVNAVKPKIAELLREHGAKPEGVDGQS